MLTFFGSFSLAYIATTLGVTGLYHLASHRSFRETVRRHDVVPDRLVGPVAGLVVGLELLLASGAIAGLADGESSSPAGYLAAGGSAALGVAFVVYLARLLGSPVGASGCGCSPFSGQTTRLSLAPAAGVALASVLGLMGMLAGGPASARHAYGELGGLGLLAAGWGVTLAVLVMLSPEALRVESRGEASWTA